MQTDVIRRFGRTANTRVPSVTSAHRSFRCAFRTLLLLSFLSVALAACSRADAPAALKCTPVPASPKNVVKASDPNAVHDSEQAAARLRSAYGRLPLSFEQNTGQVDSRVKFLARGASYTIFLTENETVLTLRNHAGVTDRTLSTGKAAAQTTATAASVAASVAAPKPLGLGALSA